jgi:uncharacterized protein
VSPGAGDHGADERGGSGRVSIAAWLLMLPIHAWRTVSVHLAPRCRFHPSCSEYALEALARHGALRGFWLAARRVLRCNPWGPSGFDPVPEPNVRSLRRATSGAAEPVPTASASEPIWAAAAASPTAVDTTQRAG